MKDGITTSLDGNAATAATTALSFSRGFADWLGSQKVSLIVSSYQSGGLISIGRGPQGHVVVTTADFRRAMGLAAEDGSLWLGTIAQIWRLENVLKSGELANGKHDAVYVPRASFTVGDLDIHELAIGNDDQPIFVNTKYSCLATTSKQHSFRPIWKPEFISKLAAEDRCHLNGIAMERGKPRYVTAISTSDVTLSWKEHRHKGGVLIDVTSDEIVAVGLSMPHSPRMRGDEVWLLDSGRGWLIRIEAESGKIERVTFCPGFLRGLVFHGDFALVTASMPRDGHFKGLELDDAISAKGGTARCAVFVIDLRSGDIVEWMQFDGAIRELFDITVLDGTVCPLVIGPTSAEMRSLITHEELISKTALVAVAA